MLLLRATEVAGRCAGEGADREAALEELLALLQGPDAMDACKAIRTGRRHFTHNRRVFGRLFVG